MDSLPVEQFTDEVEGHVIGFIYWQSAENFLSIPVKNGESNESLEYPLLNDTDVQGKLIVYMGGKTKESSGYVSVYVKLTSETIFGQALIGRCNLCTCPITVYCKHKITSGINHFSSWGVEKFLNYQELQDKADHFLGKNGKLTICCKYELMNNLLRPAPLRIPPVSFRTPDNDHCILYTQRPKVTCVISKRIFSSTWITFHNEITHFGKLVLPVYAEKEDIKYLDDYFQTGDISPVTTLRSALILLQLYSRFAYADMNLRQLKKACENAIRTADPKFANISPKRAIVTFAIGHLMGKTHFIKHALPIMKSVYENWEKLTQSFDYKMVILPCPSLITEIKKYKNQFDQ